MEGGSPHVVVCIINGIDLTRDGAKGSGGVVGGGGESDVDAVIHFAQETVGVDIFIVTGVRGLARPYQCVPPRSGF
jgi:hypothetical protein